jgi:poly-beta-1,6-N-acetyl-D-glucosamine N-deacetylase
MRSWLVGFFLLLSWSVSASAADATAVRVLCYHDVVDDIYARPDAYSVELTQLVAQFSWMRENGYVPVSLNDVLAAREGKKTLPDKPVLLTFDDGYASFYEKVYPLLREFNYPAVLALVGEWMEVAQDGKVAYDGDMLPRKTFLSWEQVRKMTRSGLVEVASHSYALHQGILGNPQGNTQPATTTHLYDSQAQRYESDEAYASRLRSDLTRNSALIEKQVGVRPRIMVWPYGRYNKVAAQIAESLGMPLSMTLEDGWLPIDRSLAQSPRIALRFNPDLSDFAGSMRNSGRTSVQRVMHVDLDYIYDPNPEQQEKNLSALLNRIVGLGVNTVFLQAFADQDGDGNARALYFPNRHLPMRGDLFNRVSWQIASRAGAKVYAWLPVLSFQLPAGHPSAGLITQAVNPDKKNAYRRLSLFAPQTRQLIGDIYEDLAKQSHIDGLLFHDDAFFADDEDASPLALEYYARQWGLPNAISAIRGNEKNMALWTEKKTAALNDFTRELAERVRPYRPQLKTARNLYARVVTEPEAEAWFAQSLPSFVANYDLVALMAMPYLEKQVDGDKWLADLVHRVAQVPGALNKTVFELQSVDWEKQKPITSAILSQQMRLLQLNGALNFGYYPDDFVRNLPDVETLAPAISLRANPRP